MTDTMRIVELRAENVKRLKAVRIAPDKTMVRIEGRNAQGKSSVLDAIAAALGGGAWSPERPIREGAKKASVTLDLGDLIVERRWLPSGSSVLEITSADGSKLATPQKILDTLVGSLTLDPLAFMRMKPRDQYDSLLACCGVNPAKIDAEREGVFSERTRINRDAKAARARCAATVPRPASLSIVSADDAMKRQADAVAHNANISSVRDSVTNHEAAVVNAKRRISTLETQLRDERKQLDAIERAASDGRTRLAELKPIDLDALATELRGIEVHNQSVRAYQRWSEEDGIAAKLEAESDRLTTLIDKLDESRMELLASAKWPVDGLSVSDGNVMYRGIPLSQASSAEQLRVAVGIGLAEGKRCKVILCRDGSLLDVASMHDLQRIAEEYDAQVFIERVADEKKPGAIYIEDGEVVE